MNYTPAIPRTTYLSMDIYYMHTVLRSEKLPYSPFVTAPLKKIENQYERKPLLLHAVVVVRVGYEHFVMFSWGL